MKASKNCAAASKPVIITTQRLDDYSKNELILMLERAGFDNIQIYGDYSDETATMDHKDLIFVATK
jgi:hypothetical protein